MRARVTYLLVGLLVGVSIALAPTSTPCHEDEVVVWSSEDTNRHDQCVALDDMWWDPTTQTVHWFTADERPAD